MPSGGNINTSGIPTSVNTMRATNTGFEQYNTNIPQRFIYRVTGIGENGTIYYEPLKNKYGQSILGQPNPELIAYPSSTGNFQIPRVGEYVDIFEGPEPLSAGQNKSNPTKIMYWDSTEGSLNIWNQTISPSGSGPINNKSLDPTVQGQVSNGKMNNIGLQNYNNSFLGF